MARIGSRLVYPAFCNPFLNLSNRRKRYAHQCKGPHYQLQQQGQRYGSIFFTAAVPPPLSFLPFAARRWITAQNGGAKQQMQRTHELALQQQRHNLRVERRLEQQQQKQQQPQQQPQQHNYQLLVYNPTSAAFRHMTPTYCTPMKQLLVC
ncbi:hypothetical protein, conserved [Eimeria acervulina]|uniref:Uncharacterized protein n=1 Tax=Eimeria acervulina TaxID=5801 RepID=U6GI75_EIMAC|nr:hypothetical protein, conserved [Eimeria acervulina]CDI78284.1 hypothetical protein, conserved [Eimeria acervulina]